ncbi:N-formylglutamate deformylase [Burkholderia multivorans]|uniref:N-formylglutamate deformylase n=1 Tax=Burkholderia multivorans TaxID=87883 RepID=UPI002019D4E3|nr:N-formylglutamate deformylase [Burkholderia multivorans]MCA8143531.1 N-formylglutamate deformylase [Burkholderia multivorans]MCO1368541.1 N-formylglutamate deformylase [Burkholderia multivorans]MCO1380432.1 N-formylglutamate deformylase [Burkholderia multivorans]UQP21457.1 N-formylglutamate deformylase [Burkholderia multivorans]UQP92096.1 N-formylglutamate deformylase [Burkholderia multivorans]
MTGDVFDFRQGNIPLLISIPHLGTRIPADIRARLTDAADAAADTDWHLDRLYDFAARAGASMLGARYSRYVVDLNRPASGESLYPGQTTTGLYPTETFRGEPLYRNGSGPEQADAQHRLQTYWKPYHAKLREELDRLKAEFGTVLLWEAHSIASVLPRLFEGKLPDLNIGTNSGESCDASVLDAITATLGTQPYTWIANGRFKGGYITRAYGQPGQGVHAVQLEMCQSAYMNETAPFAYRSDLAARVQPVVEDMVMAAFEAVRGIGR